MLRALRELAGFARGVIYDVPRDAAPRPVPGTRVFLHGSPAWEQYLAAREQVDDGELSALLTLRPLPEEERLLVVDWGTTYANTLLLIEPRDPFCDLTEPANPVRRRLEAAAHTLLRRRGPEDDPATPWTRATPLGRILRDEFGAWLFWSAPLPAGETCRVTLVASGPDETLAGLLLPELRARFPQEAFDAALARLRETDGELFQGRAINVRIPFRTRLGLPVLYDPRCADRALRRLVNEGRATVTAYGPDGVWHYGPERPLPDEMSEEEFARLVM